MQQKPDFISDLERVVRIDHLRKNMAQHHIEGVFLGATANLRYFTGLYWHASERMLGAVITQDRLVYIVPAFEKDRVAELPHLAGDIVVWQEDEDPARKIAEQLTPAGYLAVDEGNALSFYYQIAHHKAYEKIVDAAPFIRPLRMCKSKNEIAIIQYAMDITMEVQRRVRDFLKPGITASRVIEFISQSHQELGGNSSSFAIVSFGKATSFPHGAEGEQILQQGDIILIDTGTTIDGYHSDITRTYMLEDATPEFEKVWNIERQLQDIVFHACKIGSSCASADIAGRKALESFGLGPDYAVPGIPHRIGHGIGLEIHEAPYISRHDHTILQEGMCFSNEPTLIFPGQFGIRLEDHIHMGEKEACWFTQPAKSPIDV
ncbi:M24 family metallopeptidase [Bartonella sp. LJL80]